MVTAILTTTALLLGQGAFDTGGSEFSLPPISTAPAEPAKTADPGGSFTVPPAGVDFSIPKQTPPSTTPPPVSPPPASRPPGSRPPAGDRFRDNNKSAPPIDFGNRAATSTAGPLSSPRSPSPPPTAQPLTAPETRVAPPLTGRSDNTVPTSPLRGANPQANRPKSVAEQLMARSFTATEAASVSDLYLQDVVQISPDLTVRLKNVQSYWRLATASADATFARSELAALQRLQSPHGDVDKSILEAARAAAEARVFEADLALSGARNQIPASSANNQKVEFEPRDGLFVGGYNTRLDAMFRNSAPPQDVVQIDKNLKQLKLLIDARADSLVANEHAFEQISRSGLSTPGGASQVVRQFERMRDARLAFLGSARDYNFLIAEYALRVGGPSVSTGDVLSMLIGSPRSNRTILFGDSAVQTASATSRNESPASIQIPTQIAPSGSNPNGDRSILLEPTQSLPANPSRPLLFDR
ncbi:MAG: hypothetical protein NXI22_22810 [bacterium]|nr:hypothetical protein [bacterium]